jgi:hypothetical protein
MTLYSVLLIWLAFGVISYVLAPNAGENKSGSLSLALLGPVVLVLGLIIALAVSIASRRNLSPAS